MGDYIQKMDPSRFVDVDSRVVEELLCPVCGTVPTGDDEPLQLPCQHMFCRGCIERALVRKGECPVCRTPVQPSDLRTSRPIANVISRLKVACEYVDRGCPDHVEISELARHVSECSYAPVQCQHCGEVFSQRRLSSHEGSCPKRKVPCGLEPCKCVVPMDKLNAHRESDECLGKKIQCPDGCGAIVASGYLPAHRDECPLATIPCRNQRFGCKWKGGRLEAERHLEACWFEQGHEFLALHQRDMDMLRGEVQKLQEACQSQVLSLEAKLGDQAKEIE